MVVPINWQLVGGEKSPFENSGRKLRVTVHTPNSSPLSDEDRYGIETLREFAQHDDLSVVFTDPSESWHLLVGDTPNENGIVSVTIVGPSGFRSFSGMFPRDWTEEAMAADALKIASDAVV